MRKNQKGFTMVELLAAVVILGLLSTMAIVGVSSVLKKAEDNHYKTQEKNMIMAAQSYASDNRNLLPKKVGESRVIKLEELQESKYIDEVLDRSKSVCTTGYVTIFKYDNKNYSYKPYLKCNSYETQKDIYGGTGPEITLTINNSYNNPSFSYEINALDEGKIISYNYVVYKYGVVVRDSGSVPVSKVNKVDKKEVSLKDLVPGKFKVVVTSTNIYGVNSVKEIEGDIIDKDGPQCGTPSPLLPDWQNVASITVEIPCIDMSGSGCAREVFQQQFTAESKTNFIEISDNRGNKTSCEVNTYIDRTPPSKPIIENPYDNKWINKDYSIKVSSTDATSGIAYFEYRYPNSSVASERNWVRYSNSSKNPRDGSQFTTPAITQERADYIEVRACDYAGNCSETTRSMIKIDKTKPTCSISRNIKNPNGQNGWYISDVGINMAYNNQNGVSSTAVASPISYELTTSTTAVYSKQNLSATQGETSGVIWRGYVKDEAGNVSSCADASTLKIDKGRPTKPTLQISGSSPINVMASSSDSISGIDYFEQRVSGSTGAYTKCATGNPGRFTTTQAIEVRAVDKAGNVSDYTLTKHCNISGGTLTNDSGKGWICLKDATTVYATCTGACHEVPTIYPCGTGWYSSSGYAGATTYCNGPIETYCETYSCSHTTCPSGFSYYGNNKCYKAAD